MDSQTSERYELDTNPPPRELDQIPNVETGQRRRRAWLWLPTLLLLGIVAYVIYARVARSDGKADGSSDPARRAIPVAAALARKGDMEIFLNGLGSVTPLSTITIRTRVDGELTKVSFAEGQNVREGELLFEIDRRPFQVQLEQAQGQMARDQALLKNARADLERYEVAKEAVSRQQIDTAAANVTQYEGAVKIDQGQIDNATLQLTYSRIISPLGGRIGLRTVDQGNVVHASDANGLAVITQLQPIAVLFSLPEDNIPRVMRKMSAGATLRVDAYDRDLKVKLATGTLLAIDSQIDPASATVRFKAVFPNTDFSLFPNQFVNARLLVDTLRDVILVPAATVQRSPTSIFVYVVKPDATVQMRDVVIGPTEADETVIESGLAAGETVVTDGVDRLQEGTKVVASGGRQGTTRPTTRRASSTGMSSTRPRGGQ